MRGLSELVSAVILIGVVISGLFVYTTLSQQRIFAGSQTVSDALENSKIQYSEMIKKIIMTKNQTASSVILINIGRSDVQIDKVFVDSVTHPAVFQVLDIEGKTSYGNVIPALDSNSTVNLSVNQTYGSQILVHTAAGNWFTFNQ
jgi:flagellin-like protein